MSLVEVACTALKAAATIGEAAGSELITAFHVKVEADCVEVAALEVVPALALISKAGATINPAMRAERRADRRYLNLSAPLSSCIPWTICT